MIKTIGKEIAHRCGFQIKRLRGAWGLDPWTDLLRINGTERVEIVFDVGANEGQTTQELAKFFPFSTIYAFEPHPEAFPKLKARTGRLPNVRPMPVAVGERMGTARLRIGADSKISSLAADAPYHARVLGEVEWRELEVPVTTVDTVAKEQKLTRIDLLKTDVEGLDLEVLKGAAGLLEQRRVHFIYCEFNDIGHPGQSRRGDLIPFIEFLTPYGFRLAGVYTDYVQPEHDFFAVRNVLFVCSEFLRKRTEN